MNNHVLIRAELLNALLMTVLAYAARDPQAREVYNAAVIEMNPPKADEAPPDDNPQ